MERVLGRDRDPFDRTVAYLRERLAEWRPLQGAVISISGLAQTLDLSHTPVREALATLAGEGLIVRTPSGYSGATFTPATLAAHYDLADLLVCRAIVGVSALAGTEASDVAQADQVFAGLVAQGGDIAVREGFRRVDAQLAPFRRSADAVVGDGPRTLARIQTASAVGDRRAVLAVARSHYSRRKRSASRILASAIGLGSEVQI